MHTHSYALDTTWRVLFKDLGIPPTDVLRRAGLDEDLLQRSSVRLSPLEYYRLWDSLEMALGDALLPIRVCETIRSDAFSPPLFAGLCSPNLLLAAKRIARYKTLIAPIRLEVKEGHGTVTVEFKWPDGPLTPPVSLVLTELLFCVSLARLGTREQVQPTAVTTTVLPVLLKPYEDYLGTRLKKGEKHQLTFSIDEATRPFVTSNEPLWEAFEPELRQSLAHLDPLITISRRVHAVLLEGLPGGQISMEAVAAKLALSKRTLQRRIGAEGTSYLQILNETREALARHYLEKTKLPAGEIAFLLGFDEPNSFYRAFRNWTGTTPDSVRSAQHD
ncbi:TPA: AraC family transcriptional regulator ligand-binding domain-containing protein [Klebsiella quasipneumoniae]